MLYDGYRLRTIGVQIGGWTRAGEGMDVFNLNNGNTVLAQRRNQAAANANKVSQILSPRIIRFGVRASW